MQLPARIAIGCGLAFTCILIFGWVAFPTLIKSKIKSMVSLKPGNDVREMYLKLPFALTFKIFVFNLTNPDEVTNGATPIVEEVGPYVYEEWREKELVSENEDDDTMTFYQKDTFIFKPELSGGLTGDETVTIPHPMIVALVLVVMKDKPGMLTLLNKAIKSIYKNPKSPFLTATVNQIFFDGVIINCTVSDFPGKAVCTQLRTEAKDLQMVSEKIFKFSLLGPKNGTTPNKFKVKRGIEDYRDIGRVLELNDKKELEVWGTKECNQYAGTDSTIFPSLIPAKADIPSFAASLCRSISAKFDGKAKYDGIKVSRYIADFGDVSSNAEDKCYCSTPDTCLKKGTLDLTNCSVPVVATLPHFYKSDDSYVNGVKGIHPVKDKHELVILFETMTGSPLSARNRIQFNLPILPMKKIDCMKDLPDVLLPMFWIEESVDLNSTFTQPIKVLFVTMKAVKIISWTILTASIVGLVIGGYMHYSKKNEVQITPVKTIAQKQKDSPISMVQGNNVNGNDGGVVNHAMSGHEFDKY